MKASREQMRHERHESEDLEEGNRLVRLRAISVAVISFAPPGEKKPHETPRFNQAEPEPYSPHALRADPTLHRVVIEPAVGAQVPVRPEKEEARRDSMDRPDIGTLHKQPKNPGERPQPLLRGGGQRLLRVERRE